MIHEFGRKIGFVGYVLSPLITDGAGNFTGPRTFGIQPVVRRPTSVPCRQVLAIGMKQRLVRKY